VVAVVLFIRVQMVVVVAVVVVQMEQLLLQVDQVLLEFTVVVQMIKVVLAEEELEHYQMEEMQQVQLLRDLEGRWVVVMEQVEMYKHLEVDI
jgi:hypothetical protein